LVQIRFMLAKQIGQQAVVVELQMQRLIRR
jgi:hypothetical protein